MQKTKKVRIILISLILFLSFFMLTGCEIVDKVLNKDEDEVEEKKIVAVYEEPVNNMINGLLSADSETFLKAFPDFIKEHVHDIYTDEYLENVMKNAKEEYGDDVKMEYVTIDKKDITDDELINMEKEIKEIFDTEISIEKGYEIKTNITTKGKKARNTKEDVFKVYELEGKWYVLDL